MATRKTAEDKEARSYASEVIAASRVEVPSEAVNLFKFAEFETATSRVGGTEITLRRVVLTGPWEVVPK